MSYDCALLAEENTCSYDGNLEELRKFGEALMFGKQDKGELSSNDTVPLLSSRAGTEDKLVIWLRKNYEQNSILVMSLTNEAAIGQTCEPDYVVRSESIKSYLQYNFQEKMDSLITTMRAGEHLTVSAEMKGLAQQVASLDNNALDVEAWARKLAGDISTGRD